MTGTVSTLPSIFNNIEQKEPDLVLLDMGFKNGDHAIKIAHEIHSTFNLPVVFLDGHSPTQPGPSSLSSDSFDCVSRPYRSEELHTSIELALYKQSQKKQENGPTPAMLPGLGEEASGKSEDLFSKAFHAVPSGMIITRLADGRILDANRSYERHLWEKTESGIGAIIIGGR